MIFFLGGFMNLKVWIVKNKTTITKFSEKMGISRCYLSGIIIGQRKPGPKLIKRIEEETNGEITYRDFLGDKNP